MLNFVVALPSEARPLIRHYRLKEIPDNKCFRVYQGDGIQLIISGIGKLAAASATAYLQGLFRDDTDSAWLNIGIAGHRHRALGEGVLANKITDSSSARSWYPILVVNHDCHTDAVLTVDTAEYNYTDNVLYDMEAAGFYAAASHFSTAELVHSYKIISDNKNQAPNISKKVAEDLVNKHMDFIDEFGKKLVEISNELITINRSPQSLQRFLDHWHFSHYEQNRLRRLLQRWDVLVPDNDVWHDEIAQLQNGKAVLAYMQKHLDSLPVSIDTP